MRKEYKSDRKHINLKTKHMLTKMMRRASVCDVNRDTLNVVVSVIMIFISSFGILSSLHIKFVYVLEISEEVFQLYILDTPGDLG